MHDCAAQIAEDHVSMRWHLPHHFQLVAELPRMGLIMYVLPGILVSDASYLWTTFGRERSMTWRLVMQLGLRLTRLFCLFVALPLFPLLLPFAILLLLVILIVFLSSFPLPFLLLNPLPLPLLLPHS